MKILYTSDTHIGITKEKSIRKMLEQASEEQFDAFLHLGDYCGTRNGFKATKQTVRLVRDILGDVPYVTVIGNHEYYLAGDKRKNVYGGFAYGHPSIQDWNQMYRDIVQMFEDNEVHFLDVHGLFKFNDVILTGVSGWYGGVQPPTNDFGHMPYAIEGDTHRYMQKRVQKELDINIDQLNEIYEPHHTVVFCSHFPVVNSVEDYKGTFNLYCWRENIKDFFQKEYNCQYFINGHSHKKVQGPLRYEAGSDYCKPKYAILEL